MIYKTHTHQIRLYDGFVTGGSVPGHIPPVISVWIIECKDN